MRFDLTSLAIVTSFGAGAYAIDRGGAAVAAALAVGVLLATRRVSRRGAALLAVVFAISAWRAEATVDEARHRWREAAAATTPPALCAIYGRVLASPTVRDGAASAILAVDRSTCDADRRLPPGAVARLRGVPRTLGRGDRVVAVGRVAAPYLFRNEGSTTGWARVARTEVVLTGTAQLAWVVVPGRGPGAWIDAARAHVRARIERTYHPRAAELGRALVLGESDLDPEDDEAFRRSGLSHLLAVSGTHLVVAALAIAGAVRAFLLRIAAVASRVDPDRPASAIAFVLALLYADFAGGSGSVLRAVSMLGAVLLSRAAGRRPSGARALAVSLAIGLAVDPLALLDLSFLLSAAATAGLLFLAPILADVLRVGPDTTAPAPVAAVGRAVATTLAATVACAPPIAGIAGELPILGLAANLVAAPIGELAALPVCLLHAVSSPLPALERGAAKVGSGALLVVLAVARGSSATGLSLPVPPPTVAQLAALVVGVVAIAAAHARSGRIAAGLGLVVACGALELVAHRRGAPRGELRVSALDVGQGDALLVDLPDGRLMLVDGGGLPGGGLDVGRRVILPALAARRRSRLDVVVLTHPHADHAGGLPTVLRQVEVGELWDTGSADHHGSGSVPALLAELRARGVPIRRPDELCGTHTVGGARVEVFAPCPGVVPERGENDNSFVFKLSLGRRAVLFTGDAEVEAEAELLAHGDLDLSADVLKVGHHGSRSSSTSPFVAAVRPTLAITSCGVRNSFGHPHAEATARLAGVIHGRTDLGGETRFVTDGERASVGWPAW